jgi:hypothetical protein
MSDIVWGIVGLAVLSFFFSGEPDVFDKLRARAIASAQSCERVAP